MRKIIQQILFYIASLLFITGCLSESESQIKGCETPDFFKEYPSRIFLMGFTTWPYAFTYGAVDSTYTFLSQNSDVYSEHIDSPIPWNAWMNDALLPETFVSDIENRQSRKINDLKLTVSVGLLNLTRDNLATDYDGSLPEYDSLNEVRIEDAYFKHLQYIIQRLTPDYLIFAIEINEFYLKSPEHWNELNQLLINIYFRLKRSYPNLPVSASVTLHNLYLTEAKNPTIYINEIFNLVNSFDFVSISFYPFLKGLQTKEDFQNAFGYLHSKSKKPIAIAETGHLSENLNISSFNLNIPGTECEQNEYLEVLTTQAQTFEYLYIIWWTHRDYNELWKTFPEETKDLGLLWLSNGIINEEGTIKIAYKT